MLVLHASALAAAIHASTTELHAPVWGLSASRRSAFRGHGPMPAIDAAAEQTSRSHHAGECATRGFALERQFDGPVLASVTTAKTAEACCDACSCEDECERWVFGTHHSSPCRSLSISAAAALGSDTTAARTGHRPRSGFDMPPAHFVRRQLTRQPHPRLRASCACR